MFKTKRRELEQNLLIAEKRIIELDDKIVILSSENELLRKANKDIDIKAEQISIRLQKLSDELYKYIDTQIKQLSSYTDFLKQESDNRISTLSDELYEYIARQSYIRDSSLEEYKKQLNEELWMRTFGFDNMISELQLNAIEAVVPGNRARLESLKDTHKGEKCFVIGNGPSLKASDLEKLLEKGIFCFASKGIYNIFGETEWRPDVWGVSDLDYIKVKKEDLNQLNGFIKLVCAQSIIHYKIQISNAIYYPFIQAERTPKFCNIDVSRGVHFYGTITGKLINFAMYMGFSEIYLLGCDHSFPTKTDENGNKVIDFSKKVHFAENYFSDDEEKTYVHRAIDDIDKSLKYVTDSYKDLKYFCDHYNIKVWNATRGGKLEVFPRKAFDTLMQKWM
ncbi:6-hydroxymethylpterin diphosphokinase MptE-like protein [Clostridium sp. AM58-1XD]|uniref:6-hydroxymethylpterin diphosphokinase MptE-like protein n=1 Tax=Clostridium sp. AM58-1XD TaxID=2292307 RepID=UPI000E47CE94|nr:6-hydroxymethylpterin diphosphokinase MptE-like protein [Clostridium sp. AM58-1XD]RGY94749.1 DUF115 domain-containing protein [Clostridium sp. AM58-1XD]